MRCARLPDHLAPRDLIEFHWLSISIALDDEHFYDPSFVPPPTPHRLNQSNSKVGTHIRFQKYLEKNRLGVVGYTITPYVCESRIPPRRSVTMSCDQLSHCVVRLTYAAAIYHSPDWQVSQGPLTRKQVLKQLRCTVLACPVDTHVQSEVVLRTGNDSRHDDEIPVRSHHGLVSTRV
jgi:hypothetical protein